MNSNMETKQFNMMGQGTREVPLIKFTSMHPSELVQLGTILNFCREYQLPPPEQYAMYGSVDSRVMNVAVPNILFGSICRSNPAMEVYDAMCKEFGTDNVDKLVVRDPDTIRQRVQTILSHATDNVFKTEELEVAIKVTMFSRAPANSVDEIILECLRYNYIAERVSRVDSFDNSPMGSYDVYYIKKVGNET